MKYLDKLQDKSGNDVSIVGHTHVKENITDMPTALSNFINDIGAGGGVKITTNSTAPTTPNSGDFWYKVL